MYTVSTHPALYISEVLREEFIVIPSLSWGGFAIQTKKKSRPGTWAACKRDNHPDKPNEHGHRQEIGLRGWKDERKKQSDVRWNRWKTNYVKTWQTTPAQRLSSCHVARYLIFIVVVFPLSPAVILCRLGFLHRCPRVPGENKAEDWTRHLYSGALMESLRLKWQEVKGEWTENGRQLHTAAAAVALPNHSTVMLWEVCVCVPVFGCLCLWVKERRRMSESLLCVWWLWMDLSNLFFVSSAFFAIWIAFWGVTLAKLLLTYFFEYIRKTLRTFLTILKLRMWRNQVRLMHRAVW